MTPNTCCVVGLGAWILVLGISVTTVPLAHADQSAGAPSDRRPFCNPGSPPSRNCRPAGTDRPAVPPAPRAVDQTEPIEPYGILPHMTIEEKIDRVRRVAERSGVSPEVIERITKDMEKDLREHEARPKPMPQTGIFPGETIREQLGAGSSSYYLIENGWFDIVRGKDVMVYAGSYRSDPANDAVQYDPSTTHGFVIIVKGPPGQTGTTSNQVYTPRAVGSLHIVAAEGTVLTLQSRQGNKFLLNVETEQLTPLENVEPRPR